MTRSLRETKGEKTLRERICRYDSRNSRSGNSGRSSNYTSPPYLRRLPSLLPPSYALAPSSAPLAIAAHGLFQHSTLGAFVN